MLKRIPRTLCTLYLTLLLGCSCVLGSSVVREAARTAHATSSVPEVDEMRSGLPPLAGWTFKGLNWQLVPNTWETETVISSIRQYGVNAIRRHFASAPVLEQGAATRVVYFRRWHTVADWCAQHGLWIIFDFYTRFLGGDGTDGMRWVWEMPEPAFLELWRVIAQEMKGHGNVLLELGNEPNDYGRVTPAHRTRWLQRCVNAITVIRDAGFTGYIVIPLPEGATDGHTASRYRQQVAATDPLNRYLWDFHYYWYHHELQVGSPMDASLHAVRGWLDRKGISALRASGDRVLCGEFGVYSQDPDPRDLQWFRNLLTILRRDSYDLICEAYQPGADFPQLQGAWDTTDWTTLNQQGRIFVASLPFNLTYYSATARSPTLFLRTIQRFLNPEHTLLNAYF